MKKIYLFLGAAAMMASCSNEELVPNASSQNGIAAKGIVFEVTQEAPQTRGEFTKDEQSKHHFFWYAEQDRINLYANNVIANASKGGTATGWGVAGEVTGDSGQDGFGTMPKGPAKYKATQSATTGLFTAVNDENWIEFAGDKKVCAIATYPATTTVTGVDATQDDWINGVGYPATTKKVNWVSLSTAIPQAQTSAYNTAVSPMLSVTYGTREASYQSVTEKMPLQFKRLFPIVCISGVANNDSFNADFDVLKTVTITSEGGELKEGGNNYKLNPSTLAAATVECKAVMGEDQKISKIEGVTSKTTSSSSIEVEVAPSGKWWSKDRIYVSILPVSRIGQDKKRITDKVTLTFDYKNVTIHQDISTSNDWDVPNAVYSTKALDIAELYPYILTKGTSGNARKLIINKGRLSDAIEKKDETHYYVIWDDNADNCSEVDFGGSIGKKKAVAVSNITELEIREGAEALNNNDWEELRKLTALTKLTIKNSTAALKKINELTSLTSIVANNITTIEYNAMKELKNLASVEMNGVTNIQFDQADTEKNMPINKTALATVKMNSFDFAANKTLTKSILNPATLVTLEMMGVENMKEVYPKDGMSLSGYEKLASVKVQDGVVLGPEAFKGCIALTSVDGTVTLGGYGAFQNCKALTSVRLSEDAKIYDYTFDGATSLAKVYKGATGETEIKPVEVGAYAFQNTATNIDLTQTETIKAYAFKGVTTLKGVKNSAKDIYELTVNAHTIGNHAFMNCTGIQYVQFTNLTLVNRALLAGTAPKELKFVNKVDFAEDFQSNGLGATGGTKLFVNSEQEYEGNKLVVKNKAIDFTIIFKTIVEN